MTYETADKINLSFRPGDTVALTELAGGNSKDLYSVSRIEIDLTFDQAVKYFLKPKPKGGSEWYYSNQLQKIQ